VEAFQGFNPFIALHDSKDRGEEHVSDIVHAARTEEVDGVFHIAALDKVGDAFLGEDGVQDVQFAKDRDTGNAFFPNAAAIENADRGEGTPLSFEGMDEAGGLSRCTDDECRETQRRRAQDMPDDSLHDDVPCPYADATEEKSFDEKQATEEGRKAKVVSEGEECDSQERCGDNV